MRASAGPYRTGPGASVRKHGVFPALGDRKSEQYAGIYFREDAVK